MMSTASIDTYKFVPRDSLENFHGNQLVYLHWEDHLMFCAPVAFPLAPAMLFGEMVTMVLSPAYSQHPDFKSISWPEVKWTLDSREFVPDFDTSLAQNGVGHKSLLRFATPGLRGIGNKHF